MLKALPAVVLLAAVLAATACGAPAPPKPGVDPQTAERGAEPRYGGTALLAMSDTPENTHTYASTARGTTVTFNHYYEPLVAIDMKDEWRIDFPLMPTLASGWDNASPKIYKFKIRSGVTWQDGKPFTAEDAAWSLNYLRDPANRFVNRNYVADVERIGAQGDILQIELKEPNPYFLQDLRDVDILPRHVFEAGGAEALATKTTSPGPFELVSMDRSSRTKFKKYAAYWGKDEQGRQQPFLDGIEVIHNVDISAQRAAFAAGQNDILSFPDRTELNGFAQRLSNNKDLKVIDFHYANGPGYFINVKRSPFNNPDIRKAANLVINRQSINENFSSGEGLYATPIVPAMKTGWGMTQEELLKRPGWRAGTEKSKDLDEAKALLQKAGLMPDQLPEIRVIATATWTSLGQAEQSVGQFKQFGFKVRFEPLDGATFNKEFRDGNWDLAWQVAHSHQQTSRANRAFRTGGSNNFAGISDPELDGLLDKLAKSTDSAEQKQLGRQAQLIILDRVYGFPIVDQRLFHVTQPWLYGYRSGRANQQDFQGSTAFMWIDTARLPSGRK